jgi:hypothetical protein
VFAALGKITECSGKDHLPAAETGPGHPGRSQVAGIFRLRLRNTSGVMAFTVHRSPFGVHRSAFESVSEKTVVFSKYFTQAVVGQRKIGVVVNPLHGPCSNQSVDDRLFRRFRGRGQQRVQLIVS